MNVPAARLVQGLERPEHRRAATEARRRPEQRPAAHRRPALGHPTGNAVPA
jgi:hypothetical protein